MNLGQRPQGFALLCTIIPIAEKVDRAATALSSLMQGTAEADEGLLKPSSPLAGKTGTRYKVLPLDGAAHQTVGTVLPAVQGPCFSGNKAKRAFSPYITKRRKPLCMF